VSTVEVKRRRNFMGASEAGAEETILYSCIEIHSDAVQLCPVDKGQLRNSIMWKTTTEEGGLNSSGGEYVGSEAKLTVEPKKTISKVVGYVGTGSDHWYPEFGTITQAAQPFMRPAGELFKGGSTLRVMGKYCRARMERELRQRKYEKLFNG